MSRIQKPKMTVLDGVPSMTRLSACVELDSVIDWPPHSLDLFIRVVKQNGFKLSATKRASHFDWMTDDEVARFERAVERAFAKDVELDDILVV